MPTGYTADVADGKVTDFRTFALRCARAMGATILQRDEPMDAPPRLAEPSDFYAKHERELLDKLCLLDAMTEADAQRQQNEEAIARAKLRADSRHKRRQTRQRYEEMIRDTEAWVPPTADHAGLKKFMLEQLRDSVKLDCSEYAEEEPAPESPAQWLARQRAQTAKDIGRAQSEYAAEVSRANGRNAWIQALYTSLEVK